MKADTFLATHSLFTRDEFAAVLRGRLPHPPSRNVCGCSRGRLRTFANTVGGRDASLLRANSVFKSRTTTAV